MSDKYIGLDLGTTTLGVAISDSLGIVHGVENFNFEPGNYKKAREHVIKITKKFEIYNIVIGFPLTLDGIEQKRCESVKRFCNDLKQVNNDLNIYYQDERYSTIDARERLMSMDYKKAKQDKMIDMVAAIIILEKFLEEKKNGKVKW